MNSIGQSGLRVTAAQKLVWVFAVVLTCFSFSQSLPSRSYVRVEYPMEKLVASRSGPELPGRKLFMQRCSLCHIGHSTDVPFGGWINSARIEALGQEVVRELILEGTPRMPAWKYTLKLDQVNQVIAYLKTIDGEKKIEPMPSREAVVER